MDLTLFAQRYPPQKHRVEPANDGELRLLEAGDGVRLVSGAPVEADEYRIPNGPDQKQGCHLWVFLPDRIPYVLESAPDVNLPLETGVAKHTNLTGGDPACCGGELWVDPTDSAMVYVNGASGRYGPGLGERQKLADAEEVFRSRGLTVRGFGWDDDHDLPARVWRPRT